VRLQIVMALIATLVLVAVPLYLWRRPQPEAISSADAAVASNAPKAALPFASQQSPASSVAPLEISPIKVLSCKDPGPGRTPPERCDGIRALEDALTRAIRDSQTCAPATKQSFVMSYNLDANFAKKRLTISLGGSTTLGKSKRAALLKCVEKAFVTPDWDRVPHQHQRYAMNAIVTYPPSSAPEATSATDPKPAGSSRPKAPGAKPKSKWPKPPAKK
jgi:hypothetical protein